MTAAGPDRSLGARIAARVGPEIVGFVLAIGWLGIAVTILLPRAIGVPGTSQPQPNDSASPSASAEPSPSLRPGAARSVLEINGRLLELRTSLLQQADRRATDGTVIGDLLRQVNTQLVAIETAGLADLARDPLTADVATRLRAANSAAFAAARRTLSASVSNLKAYRDGARQVGDALGPIAALSRDLDRLTGGTPTPSPAAAPSQSAGAS